ncbi:unnamed protein product [Effrenium voratum]|nr:unnamed protein product [Effrenium voratum]
MQTGDVISFNAAISACETREYALELLQEMPARRLSPDLISFNAALSAPGTWDSALEILAAMQRARRQPDSVTCSAAVLSCAQGRRWDVALSLFFSLGRADAVAWNSVLKAAPNWETVLELMGHMRQALVQPDVVAFSTAIAACAEDSESGGSWQMALHLLQGVQANEVTYGAAVTAMARNAQWQRALVLLSEAHGKGQGTAGVTNAAIAACERSACWQWALSLFHGLDTGQADDISYCTTIGACAAATEWHQALGLLDHAPAAAYAALLGAWESEWQNALALLRQMRDTRVEADDACLRAAMGVCHTAGRWERSLELMKQMQQEGLALAILTCNFAMTACARGLHWTLAISMLRTLQLHQLTPGSGSLASAGSACDRGLQWAQTLALLRGARGKGVQPSLMLYGTTVSALEKNERWRRAVQLLRDLHREGLEAELVTCNSAISACEKGGAWPWATQLLTEEMLRKDLECDEISFNAAISACKDQWLVASLCLEAMQLWSLQPGVVTYQVLLPAMEAGGGFVPQGLWPSEPRRQVEALELLEATGGVPVLAPAKFAKMVYLPRLFPALRQLAAGSSAPGGPRLHEPQLEQHFSLGALFTSAALQDLDMDRSSPWLGSARNFAWKALRSSGSSVVTAAEPSAAGIAAWVSQTLASRPSRWSGGFGAEAFGPPWPIFVEHDRSQHAERGMLQLLLHCCAGASNGNTAELCAYF